MIVFALLAAIGSVLAIFLIADQVQDEEESPEAWSKKLSQENDDHYYKLREC